LAARLAVATREFVSLERYADAEEHTDGSATLSYRVASIDWLVRRVLQYEAEADVLEPSVYRAAMRWVATREPSDGMRVVNRRTDNVNELLVGFGTANGSFTFPAGVQTHQATPGGGWGTYDHVFAGDVNNDGKADLIWTTPAGDAQVYVALAK